MKYEKAKAQSISFAGLGIFMGLSTNYESGTVLLAKECGGYNPETMNPSNFTCSSFAGYGPKPGNKETVTFGTEGGHQFTFNSQGNHWYCSVFSS